MAFWFAGQTVEAERDVFERQAKGVAVVVSMDDLQTPEALEDAADLRAAIEARKGKGLIPWEQVKAELGLRGTVQARKPARRKKSSKAKA